MSRYATKDIEQIIQICNTFIEGLEQLSYLQRCKKVKESVFLCGSLIEGITVISTWINNNKQMSKYVLEINNKIANNIFLLAESLEKGTIYKSLEILQFSLIPQSKKLLLELKGEVIERKNKEIIIGVYLCQNNPLIVMPEARVAALNKEAQLQGSKLIFFSSEDVDFLNEKVEASVYGKPLYQKKVVEFPDVIHNINPTNSLNRSNIEKKLRKIIPFTTFGIGDKLNLPAKFIESKLFAELLVPFKVITNVAITIEFIEKNKKAVIKPLLGRQGQKIYFIEKKAENKYLVRDHKKKVILQAFQLKDFIHYLLSEKGKYMVQRYINSRTKDKSPFDIRAHMQKNGDGEWTLTKIYPRIGSKKSILSNISRGGRTGLLNEFLKKEFGELKSGNLESNLVNLAFDLAWWTDKCYGSAIDELGLDLAIDENNKIWLHEINGGPQSTFHEEERALNTIAYAKYIKENALFLSNQFDKLKGTQIFESELSKLEHAKLNGKAIIGMLISKEVDESSMALKEATAYVANFEGVNFFCFSPEDVDIFNQKIKGHIYESYKWVPYIFNYPDVIIDRYRMRNIQGYDGVYQEFSDIPFTNINKGGSMNKLDFYNLLKKTGEVEDTIIPYKNVTSFNDLKHFTDSYETVILKPLSGSFGSGIYFIEKKNNNYTVRYKDQVTKYSRIEYEKYFSNITSKKNFVVQKFIETRTIDNLPFDIRVHMVKDPEKQEWEILALYPRVGFNHHKISLMKEGGYISEWKGFLGRNFPQTSYEKLTENLKNKAFKIIDTFEKNHTTTVNEVALDLALTRDLSIYLIEANINKPAVANFEFKYAKFLIKLAKHLI
ncbi:YheC/YheD family protein [Thalassorhabdus alkalitolerans]|uniref:YheC/YheD family protein n=1 Tax=Thalassorhabdus alkalitolerans TaxID=2282697 RepID=A0ABW0YJ03_9BACI